MGIKIEEKEINQERNKLWRIEKKIVELEKD